MFVRISGVVCLFAGLAFGQSDANSVTVTASRNPTLQPDVAVFRVTVASDLNTSLGDVIAAVQGAGITLANFSGVTGSQLNIITPGPVIQQSLLWTFGLNVPLAKTKDTVAALTTLQQNLQKNTTLKLSFAIQGTQVSQQLAQAQACTISDLLEDARAQAQNIASATGRTVGAILAMASATSSASGNVQGLTPSPCLVTVKFGLGN